VEERLAALREQYDADLAIVNGENAADGAGITGKLADKLLAAGADVVTLGNHTYRRGGIASYLAASERVIRPENSGSGAPGRGLAVVEARNGVAVAVVNLLGQLFLPTPVSPWEIVDALVEEARAAVQRGARFLVSPVMDPEVIAAARELGVASIPGCHTPTEMFNAHRAGAPLQKLFPAPGSGPAFLRATLAPMPFLRIVPTNGIDAGNARAWLDAGAFAVGFTNALFDPAELAAGRFDRIEERARALLAAVR